MKSLSLLWCCRDCYCLGVLIIVRGVWVFNDDGCCGIEATTLLMSSNVFFQLLRGVYDVITLGGINY